MPMEPELTLPYNRSRVMIYIKFVALQTLMLHTKFQGNWPSGSEEDF